MVPGIGRSMQLLIGDVNLFRELALYVFNGFSVYRQRSYEYECCEVIVVRICSSSHDFYVFGVYRNLDLSIKF